MARGTAAAVDLEPGPSAQLAARARRDQVAAPCTFAGLRDTLGNYLPAAEIDAVGAAYAYADQAHSGQLRLTGHPYISHPLAVAAILAQMRMDHETLMAALLHDVIEDTAVAKATLGKHFGKPVAELVDGVSKLSAMFSSHAEAQASNMQKMVLAMARDQGFACHCLSFDYGQRHGVELEFARRLATELGAAEHRVARVDLGALGGSALTDSALEVPDAAASDGDTPVTIPVTYVPARNTVFLAYALAWAEVLGARRIFIGVNAIDYSGYPDCRPAFIQAFEAMANLATKAGVEGEGLTISAPLIDLTKAQIIGAGAKLGVNYAHTASCYRLNPQGEACGACDSCVLRAAGFRDAGLPDPTVYVA